MLDRVAQRDQATEADSTEEDRTFTELLDQAMSARTWSSWLMKSVGLSEAPWPSRSNVATRNPRAISASR